MNSPKGRAVSWIIFIVLIVGALVALVFLTRGPEGPEEIKEKPPVTEEEVKVPKKPKGFAKPEISEAEQEELDQSALTDAFKSGEGCASILYDKELRLLCEDTLLYNDALAKGDEFICEGISDVELKEKCIDQVLLSIATTNRDLDLCEQISDKTLRQNCLDVINAGSGRMAESAQTCEVISDATLRQSCLDNFYLSASIENLSQESCTNIADSKLRDRCTSTVIRNIEVLELAEEQVERTFKTTEEKLQECGNLSDEKADTCKDDANYNLAAEKKDLSYCNIIKDAIRQNDCINVQSTNINTYYLKLATSTKDSSLCAKVLDADLRATCLEFTQ